MDGLEQAFCQEHAGHHVNLRYHHKLLTTMRTAFQPMSYLWPISGELGVIAEGAAIPQSPQRNRQCFEAMRPVLAQLDRP